MKEKREKHKYIQFLMKFIILLLILSAFITGRLTSSGIRSDSLTKAARIISSRTSDTTGLDARTLVLAENPGIIPALSEGAMFGGKALSPEVGLNIFSAHPSISEEIRKKTTVTEVDSRIWLIQFPIVNTVLFETDEGLVLIDTGMAGAGPVLREIIEELSDKPLRVIIYTHYHVDHAYGSWALTGGWEDPVRIIAQENLPGQFDRYKRTTGNLARLMSQKEDQIIDATERLVYPTETFRDNMSFTLGQDTFELFHMPGETVDQLYVWNPERAALASADYYQGFLPNAGNGKRVQRYVELWAEALRNMADLKPEILLPGHGPVMYGTEDIVQELTVLSQALYSIHDQVIDGLNAGLRPGLILDGIELPERLKKHHSLRTVYATPKDIARMVLKQYNGWWDGLPSNYNPPSERVWAEGIMNLAGGILPLVEKAYDLADEDIASACRLADYAWIIDPDHPEVKSLILDLYGHRISEQSESTQEMMAYLDHLSGVRQSMR